MSNEVAAYKPTGLMDPTTFEHMQRVGKLLAVSPLFPEHLRKGATPEVGLANAVLCMNMAMRLNEDVLTIAQNIYFVSGKPGWNATYMIAKANMAGKFKDPIDWDYEGEGDKLKVTAWALLATTGKRVSAVVDMAMARAEGWTKNAKYQTMPRQMLSYRSATFLIRLYVPEVMVGVPSAVELEDEAAAEAKDVTPGATGIFGDGDPTPTPKPAATPKRASPKKADPAPPPVEDAEVVHETGPAAVEETKPATVEVINDQTGEVTTATAEPESAVATDQVASQVQGAFGLDDAKPAEVVAETVAEVVKEPAPQTVQSLATDAGIEARFKALKASFEAAESTQEINDLWTNSKPRLDAIKAARPELFEELAELADSRAESLIAKG